jgi:carbamoyl-phosphate synthase large subunit
MIIFVDIDKTICTESNGHYENARPIKRNIAKINRAFDAGHTIVYCTARGATTGINWKSLTKRQLKEWGVKYHKLMMNKPFYDLFIDDKACSMEDLECYLS